MGEISEKTRVGIVTFIDNLYNYVWSYNLGAYELRFPRNPAIEFQEGEVVLYVQSHDTLSIQIVHNLTKWSNHQLKVERGIKIKWKVEVNLMFASNTSKQFREAMANDDEDVLKAFAWAEDFLVVASYVEGVEYEAGVVYRAYITRIFNRWEPLARKVGTLFAILGKKFEKVTDPEALSKFREHCPWKEMFKTKIITPASSDEGEMGLPSHSTVVNNNFYNNSNSNKSSGLQNFNGGGPTHQTIGVSSSSSRTNGISSNENMKKTRLDIYEQPIRVGFADTLQDMAEGKEKVGLIVCCEREYSVIWSPTDDLVRVQVGPQTGFGADDSPLWPVCSWVKYRCMPEDSQLLNGVVCKNTVYDIKRSAALKDVKQIRETVAVRCTLTRAIPHSSEFFIAHDPFFKAVFCSCRDKELKERMEDENASVEVFAIFSDVFTHSRWIAFAVQDCDTWIKVKGLPPTVDSQVEPFFTRFTNRNSAYETTQNELLNSNRFKPPSDWKGVRHENGRIIDVLGVVVTFENENQTSVIATTYGLARQPTTLPLGIWVRATIVPDEHAEHLPNKLRGLGSFIVQWSRKIAPPISTRVVNDKGIEKLLLCCNVKAEDNLFTNDYLGNVEDPNCLVNPQDGRFVLPGYLVELCLSRVREGSGAVRFWKILKNHGEFARTVNTVALKLSYFPHDMGRTCDDAHSVLLDPVFEGEKIAAPKEQQQQQSQPFKMQNPLQTTQLKKPTNSSSLGEEDGEEFVLQQKPFAASLSYQPKAPTSSQLPSYVAPNPHQNEQKMPVTSSSDQSFKPACRIFTNVGREDIDCLSAQLSRYKPVNAQKKRQLGIVVVKNKDFAVLYTKMFGDSIVLPCYVESKERFDEIFVLGRFVGAAFAKVENFSQLELTYPTMCLPEFKTQINSGVITRLMLGQFVQVYITCDFTKANIQECIEDLDPSENEQRYCIETDVGRVLLNTDVMEKNELLGKVAKLWLTHVQKRYGCYWQIVLTEMNSLQESSHELDGLVIVREGRERTEDDELLQPQKSQKQQTKTLPEFSADPPAPSRTENILRPDPIHFVRNEYADFLFGSRIPEFSAKVTGEEEGAGCDDDFEGDVSSSSAESDHFFSDDSADFEQRFPVNGGSTPPQQTPHREVFDLISLFDKC